MDDAMDVPPKTVGWEESRRDRPKERGAEDKRRERDATERRFEKEERVPRRNHTRSSQERLGVGDRKERDREYKRRKSVSPPPVNKDWRHSPPPSRRSPPYKRRREVVFEGSRRRSFGDEGARGFANDNRMDGFDGSGLYLPKMMEDENKLDCANFQGFNTHSYTTISYGDSRILQKETLMTYKNFILQLEDDISPKEAQCRFEAYKEEYITTKKKVYFKKHKDDDWLRDKYDPTRLQAFLERRNENAKIQAKEFLSKLQTCSLCLDSNIQSSTKKEYGCDMDYGIKKRKLSEGYSSIKQHNGSISVHLECSNLKRILNDINLQKSLITKLDSEKGIKENILLIHQNSDKIDRGPLVIIKSCKHANELEGVELLEVMCAYLWCVHFADYYGMMEYKEKPKKNRLKGAFKVKSNESGIKDTIFVEWERKLETTWQTRLQTGDVIESMFGKEMLQVTTNDALNPFVRKIRDEKYGWKYGCGVKGCAKLFHGAEFVQKHLKLKHSNLVPEIIRKAQEKLYFENYMSDVDAPGINYKASMHLQHAHNSNDKSQQNHEYSLSKTSTRCNNKQEVGNATPIPSIDIKCNPHSTEEFIGIIKNENFNCNGQKEKSQLGMLEALEHSLPPQFFPCLENARPYLSKRRNVEDCFEHLHMDPFMFDHLNSPPLQGLPNDMYVHHISCPPQLLMPIPGAGKKFFNNNNGKFGSFKISTPNPLLKSDLLNVSSLMIPPHVLHQDPRSIRSYHDLDKPEDDVTVIDYRSL